MEIKIGDTVQIKGEKWYEENKDHYGAIRFSQVDVMFIEEMKPLLGKLLIVNEIRIRANGFPIFKARRFDSPTTELYLFHKFMIEDTCIRNGQYLLEGIA